jgi:dipeptidyl aminopeptidase/acylaminoacyl peptidase
MRAATRVAARCSVKAAPATLSAAIRFPAMLLWAMFPAASALAATDRESTPPPPPPSIEDILRPSKHGIVAISPDGKYIAATQRLPENNRNRVVLAIFDRATNAPVRVLDPDEKSEISRVWWVGNERLFVMSSWGDDNVQQYYLDPLVVAVNVDGSGKRAFYAAIVDTLVDDDEHMLIERCAKRTSKGCLSFVQKVDTKGGITGPRLADAPQVGSSFFTDNAGNVRFAYAWGDDGQQKVWIRKGEDWALFNDEAVSGVEIELIGTSRDDADVFFLSERTQGPDVIERMRFDTGERNVVLSDPAFIVWSADGRQPIGAAYGLGVPRARFWDPSDPDAKLLRGMEAAFPDDAVSFANGSRDGRHVVVNVWSDRDPGSFYLLDRDSKRMSLIARVSPWLDPAALARSEPIAFTSRDGVALRGYLTLPRAGRNGTKPPLVVLPHGGPFGVMDSWRYDEETQLLAAQGFAVLRINYRGSDGFGRAFERAGYRQWGLKIMDDIVDGTRWAMADGRIDPQRICLWGTSFGGYAALMGAARAPELYRCAISTSGATNLLITRKWGDTHQSRWGQHYLDEAVGDDEIALFEQSPVKHVDSIAAPLMLVHGNHDARVSFEHARAMVAAMDKAGKPMDTLFFDDETHGIHGEKNRHTYYRRVLAFLRTHLDAQ